MKSISEVKDIVLDILTKHRACNARELSDRAYHEYNIYYSLLKKATKELQLENKVDMIVEVSPYWKPYHFYFKAGMDRSEVNQAIFWKKELMQKYKELKDEGVSRFGEFLIGKVATLLEYPEVEIRKKAHQGVGIGRRDIDVWGLNPLPLNFYQCIEVKNRRMYVRENDIQHLRETANIAEERWGIPLIIPAIVCRCITKLGHRYAKSIGIPVAATEKVYVSKQYESFYNEFKEALGAYYIDVAELDKPPEDLIELFREYILHGS